MEQRTLFAAVSWTGAVNDLWTTAGNWSNGQVPTAADDVTINLATNTPVRITGSAQTVRTLNSNQVIQVNGGTGVTLSVTQLATLSANLQLGGGTVTGTYTFTGGAVLDATTNGGALSNATITGDVVFGVGESLTVGGITRFTNARLQGANADIRFAPGYTLQDDVIAEGGATGTRFVTIATGGAGTLTMGAAASITLAGGTAGGLNIRQSSNGTLINNGQISAEAAGQTLTLAGVNSFTNGGTTRATAGTLTINANTYRNTGTIAITTGTTLNLGGTFDNSDATGSFGTFNNTGGTVFVTGTITNTGSTIALNSSTGSWTLLNGRIVDGNVTYANGQSLLTSGSGGTLANVNVGGEILIGGNGQLTVSGSTTFGAVRLQGANADLRMAPGFTLNSPVIADGAASGTRFVTLASGGAGTVTIGSNGVIRLGLGSGGNLQVRNSSAATLVNNGLISAESAGATLTLTNTTLTNGAAGRLGATAGTLDIQPTNWTNAGTVGVASGAIVRLGGTLNATGGIGAFDNTGGTINITGTVTSTGSTIALNRSTGSFTLLGGTISGGTITYADGESLLLSTSGGLLNSVTILGEIVLGASVQLNVSGTTSFAAARLQGANADLRMAPGFTLNSPVIADGGATGTRFVTLAVGGASTVTAAGGGIIRLGADAGGNLEIRNSSTANLVNSGLISAEAAGRTLFISNSTVTNTASGTLRATAGTLNIQPPNWVNAGTIALEAAGTVRLGGTLNATAGIGSFANNGGTVNLGGTVTNTGSTLALNTSTGSFTLVGGAIVGGNVTYANGQSLLTSTNGGVLSGVAVGGELILGANASLTLAGNTTFTAARLQGANADLRMTPGFTLNSPVIADGIATGTRFVTLASGGAGTVTMGNAAAIRLAADAGGNLQIRNSSAATLVNNGGLISAEATGRTLTVTNSTLTNNGTLQSLAGTLDVQPTNWTTTGTINVAAGATLSIGGTLDASAGIGTLTSAGLLQVTGTLINTGSTLALTGTTGPLTVRGGRISGGNVTYAGGASLVTTNSGGTLLNVAIAGDLVLGDSAFILLDGNTSFAAARLQGSNSDLRMAPGYTLASPVIAEGGATGNRFITLAVGGSGTVTLAAAGSIRLAPDTAGNLQIRNSSAATLVSTGGLISAEAVGRTLTVNNSVFTNNGTVRALAGTLDVQPTNWTTTGTLSVANGATLRIGGTLAGNLGTLLNAGAGITTVAGTINLGGAAIALSAASGPLTLANGTIRNGSITFQDGQSLLLTSSGGDLIDLAVAGDLILGNNASVTLGGTTTFATARLQGSNSDLRMAPGYTLTSAVIAEGGATGIRNVTLAVGGTGTVTISDTGSIRLGPDTGGNLQIRNSSGASLLNNGLISSEATSRTLDIFNSRLLNNGTLQAAGGNLNVHADLQNYEPSTGTLTGGRYIASGGGTFRFNDTAIATLNAELVLDGVSSRFLGNTVGTPSAFADAVTITLLGALIVGGGASPTLGSIRNDNSLTLGPGSQLTLTGDFTNAGTLITVLAGADDGSIGRLRVNGTANLGGSLLAPFQSGFDPAPGTTVTVLSAGAISGTFASFTSGSGSNGQLAVSYTPTSVVVAGLLPGAPSTPDLAPTADSGISNSDNITNVAAPTFTGTAPAGATVTLFEGTTAIGSGIADGSGTYSITVAALGEGPHEITATASTNGGEPVPSPGSITVRIDTAAPTLTAPTVPPTITADPNGAVVDFVAPVGDAGDPNPTVVYSVQPGTVFPLGTTVVTATATDAAGNVSSVQFNVVVATSPPPPPVAQPRIGGLDAGFGNGTGVVTVTLPDTQIVSLDSFTLPDGRTLTAGFDATSGQLVLTRFNLDGSQDGSFGNGGIVRVAVPAGLIVRKVQFAASGNIYALGTAADLPAVARFSPDGVPDGSFGTDSVFTVPTFAAGDRVDAVAEGTGKVKGLLIGGSRLIDGVQNAVLINILPNGTQNLKFAARGLYARPGGEIGTFNSIALTPKSGIFLGGVASSGASADNSLLASGIVVALSSSGKPAKFAAGGVAVLGVPGFGIVSGQKVVVQGDGKVLLSVTVATNAAEAQAGRFGRAILRLTAKGAVDNTFNQIGSVIIANPPAAAPASQLTLGVVALAVSPVADALDLAQSSLVIVPGGRIREIAAQRMGTNTNIVESQVVADAVDLVAGTLTVSAKKPFKAGAKVSASLRISNVGTLPGNGTVPVRLFFSTDNILDDADLSGPTVNARLKLKPGATGTAKLSFPAPTTGGTYLVLAIVNPDGTFPELTLDNDRAISTAPFTVNPPPGTAQSLIHLSDTRPFFSRQPISVLQ